MRRKDLEGQIAASLYGDLSAEEQAALDVALAADPELARERDALAKTVAAVPCEEVEFQGDLLPVLRAELERDTGKTGWFSFRFLGGAVAALGVVAVVAGLTLMNQSEVVTPGGGGVPIQLASAMDAAMTESSAQIESRDFVAARETLITTLAAYPDDPKAAEAQIVLADLYYSHFQWYKEADMAYEDLWEKYGESDAVAGNHVIIERRELLAEVRLAEYQPLDDLQRALSGRGDTFDRLEAFVAMYPEQKLVTEQATLQMAELVMDAEAVRDPQAYAAAMDSVLERCTNPITVARVKYDQAGIYLNGLNDAVAARTRYQEVVASGSDGHLLAMAEQALATLATAE